MNIKSYYKLFKLKDYRNIWLAQMLSGLGNSLYFVSLMWLIWDKTKSTMHSGLYAIIYDIPQLALGLWIGVIISRYSLKKVIIFSDIARAIGVILIIISIVFDKFNLYILYGAVLIEGVMVVINRPATNAIVPQIVPKNQLEIANATTQLTNRLIGVAGYGIAGVILTSFGALISIVYNAVSFILSAFLTNKVSENIEFKKKKTSLKDDFKEGFLYLKQEPVLIIIFSIGILMNVGGAPITVLGPAFSEKILNAGATGYGMIQASWFCGIAIGAIFIGAYQSRELWVTLAIGFFIQGIAQLAFGLSTSLSLALIFIFIHGAFMSVANIPLFSFVQRYVPTEHLPHVFSILGTLVMAINPLAFGASGFIAEAVGVKETYIIGGLLPIIATILIVLPPWLRKVSINKSHEEASL